MNSKKKIIISVIGVLLLVIMVAIGTYAYIASMTESKDVATGSGMLDINYTEPGDITGGFSPSTDRSGGLFTSAKASLKNDSVDAILNMYITPTALTNLNIPALKWEAEGVRDGNVVCYGSGDFSSASVGSPIKLFENDITDDINDCVLSTSETTFNIYIWLDANLINTSLGGVSFGATIGADSVDITGMFEDDDRFNRLPSEYQKVEYIESTGTQYIDTNQILTNNSKFEVVALITSPPTVSSALCGSRGSSVNVNNIGVAVGTKLSCGVDFNNGNYSSYRAAYIVDLNTKIKFYADKNNRNIYNGDGNILAENTTLNENAITTQSFHLFRQNGQPSTWKNISARLYYCKIWDNNKLVRNLVPCYRKSDGEIGMYDLVNDKFYTNAGTDEFSKGIDV